MWKTTVSVVLTYCIFVAFGADASKCPESELAEIEYGVKSCQKQAEGRFFVSPNSQRLCQLLIEVVDTCTKGYALCHSDVVVLVLRRAQKRVYTDKMMKMYGIGDLILNCTVPGVDDSSIATRVGQTRTHKIFVAHRYTATKICPTEAAVRDSVEAYKECADDTNRAMASSIRDELIKGDP